ncbi:MBL fold metallo-hydrolase [Conexibacter stalactiti]|uniref:MBL fold metallo-hydrolase n=1 Tax=Conexibacter stalactiti TaxID=1940611 RepID=A0ABU4HLR5_9ACTN|nr:MBL fold metallo-hydrolase [Conexibacter stalactiti]MDW5594250.1 MBL fold metallo-hydrolase [Conexibacter stalactiti]MEC5034892.1 MBL fold metallo-hydrolase [Conexibacter stalactiti]
MDADLLALQRGVHRIALPTPMVASVNCYLIVDRPLTLVDSGLNWGGTLDALERALRQLGFALEEIDLVLLTHEHVDHIGLAEAVARRAGADVACHERLAGWLGELPGSLEADDAWTAARIAAHGAPPLVVAAFEARMEMMRMLGSRPRPSVVLREGEELRLRDRTLRATLRPGHSPTDTVFADRGHDLQFTGDHLMPEARTTPYLVPGPAGGWRDDLAPARRLRESLGKTAIEAPTGLGLPGHGRPFTDVAAHAREQLDAQRRRALRLLDALDATPRTLFELVRRTHSELSPARTFLGMLELLARLELLLDEGLVEAHEDERGCRFSRPAA